MSEKTIDKITIREKMSGPLTSRLLLLLNQDTSLLDEPANKSELTVPIGVVLEVLDVTYETGIGIGHAQAAIKPMNGSKASGPVKVAGNLRFIQKAVATMIAVATKDADDD